MVRQSQSATSSGNERHKKLERLKSTEGFIAPWRGHARKDPEPIIKSVHAISTKSEDQGIVGVIEP